MSRYQANGQSVEGQGAENPFAITGRRERGLGRVWIVQMLSFCNLLFHLWLSWIKANPFQVRLQELILESFR